MGRTLQWILDAKMAGWVEVVFRDHTWGTTEDGRPVMYQYIEWSEPYQELPGKYVPDSSHGVEINGQAQPPDTRGSEPPPIM